MMKASLKNAALQTVVPSVTLGEKGGDHSEPDSGSWYRSSNVGVVGVGLVTTMVGMFMLIDDDDGLQLSGPSAF